MTLVPNGRNLIPVDPVTGGQAFVVGLINLDSQTVHGNNGDGTLTLDQDTGVATSKVAGGVADAPILVAADDWYTAAGTFDGFGAVGLQWVYQDGQVSEPLYAAGYGRVAVTGMSPHDVLGAVVSWFFPVARITDGTDPDILQVTYWDPVYQEQRPWQFAAAWETPTHLTLYGAVLIRSDTDPGPLPPVELDTSTGLEWWEGLPEVYRIADAADLSTAAGYPLRNYLKGVGVPLDGMRAVAGRVAAGELADPVLADDAWIPWLAQAAGVNAPAVADARHILSTRLDGPSVGSRAAVAVLARRWLTGTQVADVFPHPSTAWTIVVRVRSDELSLVTDAAGLRAKLMGTGQIPAAFNLSVVTGAATWAAVEARSADGSWTGMETSGAGPMVKWNELDASGVTGTS